ncbi:hypothetical protein HHL22_16695 [Hymenobacter sp. RP-2-7]|uniref:Uncharacterized protein n=1 Tax=Hymenobacter polaris TaxID=2682546 RepID=A0A7Y0AGC8_9BACT|nr:hypothetical protein [Hymenobacter polaris]NML66846.1 hypothetical protein [Hymenobacter polaris]
MPPFFLLSLLGLLAGPAPAPPAPGTHYLGTFSNGAKGDTLSFVLAPDGQTISDLKFKGYWRCGGTLVPLPAGGPRGTYTVASGRIAGRLCQEGGNCFELSGRVAGAAANGKLRLTNRAQRCDSNELVWSAVATKPTK